MEQRQGRLAVALTLFKATRSDLITSICVSREARAEVAAKAYVRVEWGSFVEIVSCNVA